MTLTIETAVPLAPFTRFHVGGPSDVFCRIHNPTELQEFSLYLQDNPQPVLVLGSASNMLIRDGGFRGCAVKLDGSYAQTADSSTLTDFLQEYADYETTHPHERLVLATAGSLLASVALKAVKAGIEGFAGLATIPGTVGGAVVGNAGAFNDSIGQVCKKIRGIDLRTGNIVNYSASELGFAYRHSNIASHFLITEVLFAGTVGDANVLLSQVQTYKQKRSESQPIDALTCGSTFKNPELAAAGKLIDDAGCRGMTLGGAQISTKHCNFLINTGQATATELEQLAETVRQIVQDKFGVQLEWEVKRIGEFA